MAQETLKHELLVQVSQMDQDEQMQVLDYAKSLWDSRVFGDSCARLLKFVGYIPPADLKEMEVAIRDGCG